MQQVDDNAEDVIKMIVATKVEGETAVGNEEGRTFAAENGCLFASTSSRLGDGVVGAFQELSSHVLANQEVKDEKLAIFQRAIEAKEAEIGRRTITFPDWFDIVADVAESDGLAAYHNFMVWGLVKAFNRYERKFRKEQIMRKFEAMRSKTDTLQVQGKISEKETSIPIVDDMGRAFHSSGGEHDPQLADDDAPADVSDMLGRKLTGYVDAVAMAVIPLLYVIVCLVELAPKTAQLYGDDSKTEIIHLDMDTSAYD